MRTALTALTLTLIVGCSDREDEEAIGPVYESITPERVVMYWDNGATMYTGYKLNDKPVGICITYYDNGQKGKVETFDRAGVEHGPQATYHENGRPLIKSHSHNGKAHGVTTLFYPSGQVKLVTNHKHGELNGAVKGYHPNGQIEYSAVYRDGTRAYTPQVWDMSGLSLNYEQWESDQGY